MNLPLELGTSLNHYFLWCIFYYENTELLIYYPLKTHPELIKNQAEEDKSYKKYKEERKKWCTEHNKYKKELEKWENKKEGVKPVFMCGPFPKMINNWPPDHDYKAVKRNDNQLEEVSIRGITVLRMPNSFLIETDIGTFNVNDSEHYAKYNNDINIKYKIVNLPNQQ
jgi:hypothetical protein